MKTLRGHPQKKVFPKKGKKKILKEKFLTREYFSAPPEKVS